MALSNGEVDRVTAILSTLDGFILLTEYVQFNTSLFEIAFI
jgi:hypothetical protein